MSDAEFDVAESAIANDKTEEGVWMHCDHPADAERKWFAPGPDGKPDKTKPIRILVRSGLSRAARKHEEAEQRILSGINRLKSDKRQNNERTSFITNAAGRRFAALAVSFDNFSTKSPGIITPSDDYKREMNDNPGYKACVSQVLVFANEPSNYGVENVGNDGTDDDDD